RKRMIWALGTLAPLFIIALVFGEQLLAFLIKPAQAELKASGLPVVMLQTNPLELLTAWLKVSTIATLIVGIPLILSHLSLFLPPGLYAPEQRLVRILLPMSVALSALGLAFLYYVMLPAMLLFLIHFGMDLGKPAPVKLEAPPGVVLPVLPILHGDPPNPKP